MLPPKSSKTAVAATAKPKRPSMSSDFSATAGPQTGCRVAEVACDASGPRLQRVAGTFGLQLDCSPWLMRAICYSPVPFGMDPGYSEPWGDLFTDEYEGLWRRAPKPKPLRPGRMRPEPKTVPN